MCFNFELWSGKQYMTVYKQYMFTRTTFIEIYMTFGTKYLCTFSYFYQIFGTEIVQSP